MKDQNGRISLNSLKLLRCINVYTKNFVRRITLTQRIVAWVLRLGNVIIGIIFRAGWLIYEHFRLQFIAAQNAKKRKPRYEYKTIHFQQFNYSHIRVSYIHAEHPPVLNTNQNSQSDTSLKCTDSRCREPEGSFLENTYCITYVCSSQTKERYGSF